jgi:leucyl-tRNA synthetase
VYDLQENVDYGAVATNLPGHGSEKYYLSTAIAYTNGYPHIGHAYEVSPFELFLIFV